MKYQILLATILVLALATGGCASAAPTSTLVSASPTVTPPLGTTSHGNPIGGHVEFVDALRAAGASVEPSEPITQAFFTPEGNILKVNGADVQVFEYESAEAMESEASQMAVPLARPWSPGWILHTFMKPAGLLFSMWGAMSQFLACLKRY